MAAISGRKQVVGPSSSSDVMYIIRSGFSSDRALHVAEQSVKVLAHVYQAYCVASNVQLEFFRRVGEGLCVHVLCRDEFEAEVGNGLFRDAMMRILKTIYRDLESSISILRI